MTIEGSDDVIRGRGRGRGRDRDRRRATTVSDGETCRRRRPPRAAAGEDEDDESAMMRMMGFGGFGTTQGKHVEDEFANASAVQKKTKRQARQYMNRVGGFNRPLPAEVTGQRQNRT